MFTSVLRQMITNDLNHKYIWNSSRMTITDRRLLLASAHMTEKKRKKLRDWWAPLVPWDSSMRNKIGWSEVMKNMWHAHADDDYSYPGYIWAWRVLSKRVQFWRTSANFRDHRLDSTNFLARTYLIFPRIRVNGFNIKKGILLFNVYNFYFCFNFLAFSMRQNSIVFKILIQFCIFVVLEESSRRLIN